MIDPLRSYPGYSLRRASAKMMADLNLRLRPLGLRATEASLLILIDANPGITQSALGRSLAIQRANMAPLIAALDAKGLLHRARVDGRSEGLSLSESGKLLAMRAHAAMIEHEAALIERVPEQYRGALLIALNAIWADT